MNHRMQLPPVPSKRMKQFPLLKDDISTEAPFCGIGTIQTGLIMAATQLITGHLS